MIFHCPLCHGAFSIEALIQDQAGRDLLVLVAKVGPIAPALLGYLSLFRSEKRALAFDRAHRLAQETMELAASPEQLATALAETVEALRAKREQGQAKPLKNHNYLKRVIESTPGSTALTDRALSGAEGNSAITSSKTARAIGRLEKWKKG